MRQRIISLVLAAASVLVTGAARASLIGTSVTGSFQAGANPANFFDPINGEVPPGPLNNAGTTVAIATPAVEFGAGFPSQNISADFDAAGLTLTDSIHLPGNTLMQHYTFTDAAFAGLTLSKTSDTWSNGGLTASLAGSVLSIDWAGGGISTGQNFSAVFSLAAPAGGAVPLPPAFWSCLIGAALACFAARHRLAGCHGSAYAQTCASR